MNVERLERLAKLLDQQTDSCPIRFDLSSWGEYKKVEENICGTAACAVGLACFSDDFKAEGLGTVDHWIGRGYFVPTFKQQEGWHAVADFFDIGLDQAAHLFHEDHYRGRVVGAKGASMVAARIRKEIKKHQEK
jgi:hypothetical protein